MLTLHQDSRSGNCYKVVLTASLLSIPLACVEVDVVKGETRTSQFLNLNPNGRVPLLVLEDGRTIAESNAIIYYLSESSHLVPADSFVRAQMLQWMFFEQYSHEPYIAVARYWLVFAPKENLREKEHLIPEWHKKGNAALQVMEGHLSTNDWFAGNACSLADIALFAYTHCAAEGGFELAKYRAVGRWLARVTALSNFAPMRKI